MVHIMPQFPAGNPLHLFTRVSNDNGISQLSQFLLSFHLANVHSSSNANSFYTVSVAFFEGILWQLSHIFSNCLSASVYFCFLIVVDQYTPTLMSIHRLIQMYFIQ